MSTRFTRICVGFGFLVLTPAALAGGPVSQSNPKGLSVMQPVTPQARVAFDFLSRLEAGRVEEAYELLDPALRQSYSLQQLEQASRSLIAVRVQRRITYEGPSSSNFNFRIPSQRGVYAQPYLVCIINAPISGYGNVTYAATFLKMTGSTQTWRISDYRIDVEAHPSCRR
jgi:hypothetical protein